MAKRGRNANDQKRPPLAAVQSESTKTPCQTFGIEGSSQVCLFNKPIVTQLTGLVLICCQRAYAECRIDEAGKEVGSLGLQGLWPSHLIYPE